jgi:peptide/nickel transport system substrate-binding protein
MKKAVVFLVVFCVVFSAVVWASGKSDKEDKPGAAVASRYGGKLIYGHPRNIYSFDPMALPGGNRPIYHQLFNTLATYDTEGNIVAELAESWKFGEDGLSLTFNLRQGVKFHNGREFVANDVAFSVERAQDKKVAANIRPLALSVKRVEVKDKYTVVFHFEKPNPAVFDLLDLLFIVNKETADSIKNNPVGTGPFKFVEWIPGTHAKLVKFEDYWNKDTEGNQLPYLDEVEIKPFPDAQAMVVNLETGAIDIAQEPSYNDLKRLKDSGKFKVLLGTPSVFQDVLLNVTKPPFDNKKVRQAINYAIDREKFVDTFFYGFSRPTCLPVPQFSMAYVPELENKYTFNLEKAKQLITEAGYPNGFEVTCTTAFKIVTGSEILAQILQADLAKIGVKMKIEDHERAVIRPKWFKGEYVMSLHNYGRAAKDPASLFGTAVVWHPDTGITQFKSEEYSRLINEGVSTLDAEKRKQIYRRVVEIALDECFTISLAEKARPFAMQPYVEGLNYSLDNFLDLEKVWLNK